MSYSCSVHGWGHLFNACPHCIMAKVSQNSTTTTDGILDRLPPIPGVPIDYLNHIEKLNVKLYILNTKFEIAIKSLEEIRQDEYKEPKTCWIIARNALEELGIGEAVK